MYWSVLLNKHLIDLGFERSKSDTCLYIFKDSTGKWVMVAVFVDDLLITGTDKVKIAELRAYLRNTFKGQASWDDVVNSFLGMEAHYDLVNGIKSKGQDEKHHRY